MILLSVNELIKDEISDLTYRILWIDEGDVIAYLIDIDSETALPFVKTTKEIREQLISDQFMKIKDMNVSRLSLQNSNEKQIEFRNRAWDMIETIVEMEPDIFQKEKRGEIIKKLMEERNFNRVTIYKHLRRYWQRGMRKDSLLPDFHKSGGKGKAKKLSDKKVGKPRSYDSVGINADEKVKEVFEKAIKKYYLSSKKPSLSHAYRMMIKEHFADDYYYEDGVKKVVILNKEEIPSERQLRYFFKKEFEMKEVISSRMGKKIYEKDHRQVLGSSSYEVFGPGSRYQIDATIADVYLISSYNANWIIGRPIVYFVVDVFSRLITGVYIGLEGPSWAGAMMALVNTASNKQEFCRQFGINISSDQWAAEHLPEVILADRGEFEGYKVEPLADGFNIKVENTPPYRPDWKGIVEKLFDTSQQHLKPFLPGYIDKDFRERGAEDYRLKAKLTLEQYTKLIIHFIVHYNNNHYMKDYVRDEEMIEANVKPIPSELWKWGLQNRAGKLKSAQSEELKFYLMPKAKATVTYKGIKFKNMLYSCESAIKESWFVLARNGQKGSWKVDISYDPRNMSNIYLHKDNGELFEACYLLDHQERYKEKTIEEVEDLLNREKTDYKKEEHVILQGEIDFISGIESVVKEAVKEANQKQTPLKHISKSQKTGAIKANRALEKEKNREKEAFDLKASRKIQHENAIDKIEVVHPFPNEEKEADFDLPSIKGLFKKRKGASV
ncbi:Mu transposase C-terminal domain-containing protein [Rossellomorea oryzaecorticis]|uniref:Mu transposase C-terminal domain-containing protein n=1 Tax=Rossellomorea oryzaecorticis TaxID=1396505 RepID=A0ABW8VUG3_9BACI